MEFGAAPSLPTIPAGAASFSGLPNPDYENGTFQPLATISSPELGATTDTFSARADVSNLSDVPEPRFSIFLLLILLLGLGLKIRNQRRSASL